MSWWLVGRRVCAQQKKMAMQTEYITCVILFLMIPTRTALSQECKKSGSTDNRHQTCLKFTEIKVSKLWVKKKKYYLKISLLLSVKMNQKDPTRTWWAASLVHVLCHTQGILTKLLNAGPLMLGFGCENARVWNQQKDVSEWQKLTYLWIS